MSVHHHYILKRTSVRAKKRFEECLGKGLGEWKNERQLCSLGNENKEYENTKRLRFHYLEAGRTQRVWLEGLKSMFLERSFGFLTNAGEEAEMAKILQRRRQKANPILAQSLKENKCSFWTEGLGG